MSRAGDWIATYTGRKWYILDPDPEDVHIEDIAHALSMVCRYGGHSRIFYSVAEHSVRMVEAASAARFGADVLLWALLHDAAESYLGDMVRPLKRSMPDYAFLEEKMMAVIMKGLGLAMPSGETVNTVKLLDNVMLMTERRDLINHANHQWTQRAVPLKEIIVPYPPWRARDAFLNLAASLRVPRGQP